MKLATFTGSASAIVGDLGRSAVAESRAPVPVDDVESRFRDGDEQALAHVYDQHGSLIYSYCVRRLGPDAARDVTQEVFVSAWRARHRFDPSRGPMRAWLMGITKNKIIDLLRKQGRRPEVAHGADVEQESDAVDGIQTDRMADRMVLAAALAELPDRARSVVELSFYQQMTHPEIAEATGLPLGTVKSDIRRSLLKLRRQLEDGNA